MSDSPHANRRSFLILSPPYDQNNGGVIALHKLCDTLNRLGFTAHLYNIGQPAPATTIKKLPKKQKSFLKRIKKSLKCKNTRPPPPPIELLYQTNPAFDTPALTTLPENLDHYIVIYPEIVYGNPLNAPHVARWFLHHPGYHTGKVGVETGEIYYRFSESMNGLEINGSLLSKNILKVTHYPLDIYNEEHAPKERHGTAYCLRKGKAKTIIHDLNDSVLIDGKSHREIAQIFRSCRQFISYDTLTAYSRFAYLCGCESIVIPDEGVSIDEWYPNEADQWGLAYGLDDLERANSTRAKAIKNTYKSLSQSDRNAQIAADEMLQYFSK